MKHLQMQETFLHYIICQAKPLGFGLDKMAMFAKNVSICKSVRNIFVGNFQFLALFFIYCCTHNCIIYR